MTLIIPLCYYPTSCEYISLIEFDEILTAHIQYEVHNLIVINTNIFSHSIKGLKLSDSAHEALVQYVKKLDPSTDEIRRIMNDETQARISMLPNFQTTLYSTPHKDKVIVMLRQTN